MQRRVEVTSVRNAGIIFFTTFFFDQGVKAIARTYLMQWKGTFFRITENPGIAFSIPVSGVLFWVLFVAVLFFFMRIARTSMRLHDTKNLFFLGMILGGGLSNALDRFRFGAVMDIFALPWGLFFNVADVAIIIGLFFLFLLCPVNKTSLTSPKASQPPITKQGVVTGRVS